MKTFNIPETIAVQGFAWSLAQCVEHVVDSNPQFNRSRAGTRAGDRIVNAIVGKSAGDEVSLLEEDWKLLDDALSEPANGYCPTLSKTDAGGKQSALDLPARHFLRYVNAISPEVSK